MGNNLTTKTDESRIISSNNDDYSIITYNDRDFSSIAFQIEEAYKNKVFPERVIQGSSGSYFIKNSQQEYLGIFKPKDEEPYAHLNPKWTKYMQKLLCPCCFGRGCLILNNGYLSEVGASLVDLKLNLNIVPKTKVIQLVSESFNYSAIDRAASKTKKNILDKFPNFPFNRPELPKKVGSFQMFVNGYKDAELWLKQFELEPLPAKLQSMFQLLFERLVILDYIIRNTDRGNDNWLIKYENADVKENHVEIDDWNLIQEGQIHIAAIDNGLAFPFKHPNEWRAYPFAWSSLKYAHIPFSEETKNLFLPKLSDQVFIQAMCNDLYTLFQTDNEFKKEKFYGQMSVLKGQIFNLNEALRDGLTPFELVQKPAILIDCGRQFYGAIDNLPSRSHSFQHQTPFFTCC